MSYSIFKGQHYGVITAIAMSYSIFKGQHCGVTTAIAMSYSIFKGQHYGVITAIAMSYSIFKGQHCGVTTNIAMSYSIFKGQHYGVITAIAMSYSIFKGQHCGVTTAIAMSYRIFYGYTVVFLPELPWRKFLKMILRCLYCHRSVWLRFFKITMSNCLSNVLQEDCTVAFTLNCKNIFTGSFKIILWWWHSYNNVLLEQLFRLCCVSTFLYQCLTGVFF